MRSCRNVAYPCNPCEIRVVLSWPSSAHLCPTSPPPASICAQRWLVVRGVVYCAGAPALWAWHTKALQCHNRTQASCTVPAADRSTAGYRGRSARRRGDERDRVAGRFGAGGSTDAVHIVFCAPRRVKVEHMRDASTSMPRAAMSVARALDSALAGNLPTPHALALRSIAVYRRYLDARLL